jgi:ribonuclease HI
VLFEGHFVHPDEVFNGALKSLAEYKECLQMEVTQLPSGSNLNQNFHHDVWCPPPLGFVKINWDAAVNKHEGYIGVGIIARDCMGQFLGARSFCQKIRADAKVAETIAALGAVTFSSEAGFFDVICEGDAAQVVADINSDPPFLSSTGHFIESIHLEMLGLRSCRFVFAPREANMAAHTLAKEAICNKNDVCWLEDVTSSISSIVIREACFSLDPLFFGINLCICFLINVVSELLC